MYHLTCPTCSCVTESPFVRGGAVVRCDSCQQKYRIKTGHIERVLHTGPRTLDETDSVLRSDSVDIEPDEAAPVSIDDDGNVVGLSGLSELMRWSDAQGSQEKLNARVEEEEKLEAAAPAKASRKSARKADASATPASVRMRPRKRRRKKRNNVPILIALGALLLASAVVLAVVATSGKSDDTDDQVADGDTDDNGTNTQKDAGTDKPKPKDPGGTIVKDPGPKTPDPKDPDPQIFQLPDKPSPVESKFVAPWPVVDPSALQVDVPTVLTTGTPVAHEGWYEMDPARGEPEAIGESQIEVGRFAQKLQNDGSMRLSGTLKNTSDKTVLNGELHVMLLNNSGNVFAETYMPLVLLDPGAELTVAMPIDLRILKKASAVRAGATVTTWADELTPMPGVRVDPVGQGPAAAARVSVRNESDKILRKAMILIKALDDQGKAVGQFLVMSEGLYIRQGQWLDLVVSTPLPDNTAAKHWLAVIHPR